MKKTEQERRIPPNAGVTHEAMPIVNIRKTRRNEKCPCGSGKKFKKCCSDGN